MLMSNSKKNIICLQVSDCYKQNSTQEGGGEDEGYHSTVLRIT